MMENVQNNWSQTTKDLYKAVLIYTISGIAVALFSFMSTISATASLVSSLAGNGGSAGFGVWAILTIVATVSVIFGYWLFLESLSRFRGLVHEADVPHVSNLRTATILALVAAVVGCIPMIGIVGGIISLIAWIMQLLAYNGLRNSQTFPELARKGTQRLFVAMILGIVGVVIGLIPLIGSVFKLILSLVAFYLMLTGWRSISESEPAQR